MDAIVSYSATIPFNGGFSLPGHPEDCFIGPALGGAEGRLCGARGKVVLYQILVKSEPCSLCELVG